MSLERKIKENEIDFESKKGEKNFSIFFIKTDFENINKETFINEIFKIEESIFKNEYDPPLSKNSLEIFFEDEKYKIACLIEKNEFKIISYIIYFSVFDETEILRIGTSKNFQRKNFTYDFFSIFLKRLYEKNKIKIFFLEVDVLNFTAINFYKKIGFFEYNRRKNYYNKNCKKNSDAIMMKKIMK